MERPMLNGRIDAGDSGEKTLGSPGKQRTRKGGGKGEIVTAAQKREKK